MCKMKRNTYRQNKKYIFMLLLSVTDDDVKKNQVNYFQYMLKKLKILEIYSVIIFL